MTTTSLASSLSKRDMCPSESKWFQFIQDHKGYIKDRSSFISIDINVMNEYKYRPVDYLRRLNVAWDIMWIVLLMNNIANPSQFVNKDFLYVPEYSLINDLRIRYNTSIK